MDLKQSEGTQTNNNDKSQCAGLGTGRTVGCFHLRCPCNVRAAKGTNK